MPKIISVGTKVPEYSIPQAETMAFTQKVFGGTVKNIERYLKVFENSEIETRYFAKPLDWYGDDHSFSNKNDAFIDISIQLCVQSIEQCLHSSRLTNNISYDDIEAIFLITSSGLATPSLDARIMNILPFSKHTKRIPVWGLGCAGGVAGLARAHEYCLAYPQAKVLVVAVELCSLTFQKDDISKSNIIGTSLFADGAAAVLVAGDEVNQEVFVKRPVPQIVNGQSTLMNHSLDVMGWDVRDNGLYVIFSKNIPTIVRNWLGPMVTDFLFEQGISLSNINHFIAHPGGKKVITAYEEAFGLTEDHLAYSKEILQKYGNMSSATVFFVLERFLHDDVNKGDYGLMTSLGPGFTSELLLVRWE